MRRPCLCYSSSALMGKGTYDTMTRWQTRCGWESALLTLICTADMLSTLYWVHMNQATEANPWMAHWLEHGDAMFCLMKLLSFLPFLAVAYYYRPRRPRLIAVALRGTLVLYVLMYVASVAPQLLRG